MYNQLGEISRLNNIYAIARHGHSMANAAGIVVSNPDIGVAEYGLSDTGQGQVNKQLEQHLGQQADQNSPQPLLGKYTLLISSDFRRARETAEIIYQRLGCNRPVMLEPRLRERFFGDYDMGPDSIYPAVWTRDHENPSDTSGHVESAEQVMTRVTGLVRDVEGQYQGEQILLVAHGDILQILLTAFAGRDARWHRDQEHLETAEIRWLNA